MQRFYITIFVVVSITIMYIEKNVQRIITEQTDGELYQAECHGFVPGIHTSQNKQHRTYLTRRVNKNEDWEENHVNPKVTALQLTVTDRRRTYCFRYRYVLSDALTIVKLRNIKQYHQKEEVVAKIIIFHASCIESMPNNVSQQNRNYSQYEYLCSRLDVRDCSRNIIEWK